MFKRTEVLIDTLCLRRSAFENWLVCNVWEPRFETRGIFYFIFSIFLNPSWVRFWKSRKFWIRFLLMTTGTYPAKRVPPPRPTLVASDRTIFIQNPTHSKMKRFVCEAILVIAYEIPLELFAPQRKYASSAMAAIAATSLPSHPR